MGMHPFSILGTAPNQLLSSQQPCKGDWPALRITRLINPPPPRTTLLGSVIYFLVQECEIHLTDLGNERRAMQGQSPGQGEVPRAED